MVIKDGMGRKINYLRLSLTDRCNNRCVYCMPENGVNLFPYSEILRLEELAGITARFVSLLGINKVRLTGGEPLIRKNIEGFVEMLSVIPGLDEIAVTTNGAFLLEKAKGLYEAGLSRLNVSLDSLDPIRYNKVTCGGDLQKVLRGLEAAKEAGFSGIKINAVLLPDFYEEEQFIEWANENGYIPRFIELMPHFQNREWAVTGKGVKVDEIVNRLESKFEVFRDDESLADERGVHVIRYRIPDKHWVFEVIPGVSNPFCGNCNRLRIDCTGVMRICLYGNHTLQLRDLLSVPDEEFVNVVTEFVAGKTERPLDHIGSNMSAIGG